MKEINMTPEEFEKIRTQAINKFCEQQDSINNILKKSDFILIDKESLKVTGKQPGRILENVLVLSGVLEALIIHENNKDLEISEELVERAKKINVDLKAHARKLIEKFKQAADKNE